MSKKKTVDLSTWIEKTASDKLVAWDSFDVMGTLVIELEVSHIKLEDLVEPISLFWDCLFAQICDRKILSIEVRDWQQGFNFYVKTSPQIRERRFELTITEMVEWIDDDEKIEKYWQVVERAYTVSGVKRRYKSSISADFWIVGTALADKKFRRSFRGRSKFSE